MRLYYDCNEFKESNWDYATNLSWQSEYLYDYMNEQTELFEKNTSEEYHNFEEQKQLRKKNASHFLNLKRQPGQSTEF